MTDFLDEPLAAEEEGDARHHGEDAPKPVTGREGGYDADTGCGRDGHSEDVFQDATSR